MRTVDLSVEQDTCIANDDIFFNVTAPLGPVTISPAGPESVCEICEGAKATSVFTGGGTVSYAWGYRAVSMGATTPIPLAVCPEYTIDGNDFPGTGTYYLVLTVTPFCGAPKTSNEIQVDVSAATVANPLDRVHGALHDSERTFSNGPYRRPGRASTFGWLKRARTVPSPPVHWIFRLPRTHAWQGLEKRYRTDRYHDL